MTNDEFRAWAMKAWEKEAMRNMPAAKASRQLKAGLRESRKAQARAKRTLAAQQASSQRKFNRRLAELEKASREREESRDREMEERRWNFLLGDK